MTTSKAKKLSAAARSAALQRDAIRLAPGPIAGTFRLVADKSNVAPVVIDQGHARLAVHPGQGVVVTCAAR
jgi:hypothetical protein